MKCYLHNQNDAVALCRRCYRAVCALCLNTDNALPLCPDCLKRCYQKKLRNKYMYTVIFILLAALSVFAACYFAAIFTNSYFYLLITAIILPTSCLVRLLRENKKSAIKNKIKHLTRYNSFFSQAKNAPISIAVPRINQNAANNAETCFSVTPTLDKNTPANTDNSSQQIDCQASTNKKQIVRDQTKFKTQGKVWECSCGKINLKSRLFCVACGKKKLDLPDYQPYIREKA